MPNNGEITSLNLKIKNDTSDAIKGFDKLIKQVEKLQTALEKVSSNNAISAMGATASATGGGAKNKGLKETKKELIEITNQFDLMKKKASFLQTLGQGGNLDKNAKEERRRVNYALQYLSTIERINKIQDGAKVGTSATAYLNASKTELLQQRAKQTESALANAVSLGDQEKANTLALQYLSIQERIESIKTAAEKKAEAERNAAEKAAEAAEKKAEAERKSAEKAAEAARKKAEAEEEARRKAEEYAIAQEEAAKAARKASLSKFFGGIGSIGSAIGKRIIEPFKRAQKAVSTFFSSITRIAFYRIIRGMLKNLTQGFSEGIKNLYAWSEAFNTQFAPTMDMFKTQMVYLKNGFASMFSPLIEWVVPNVIVPLTDAIVELFNYIQQGFAILVGHDYWYKAQKSMQKFGEATGKANIQLAKFDEINNLTETGSGSEEDASGMFTLEKVATGAKFSFFKELRDAIKNGDWKGIGEEVASGFNRMFDKVSSSNLGNKIIGIINDAINFALGFSTTLNWSKMGDEIGKLIDKLFTDVEWGKLGEAVGAIAGGLVTLIINAFSEVKLENVLNAIFSFIDGLAKKIGEAFFGDNLYLVKKLGLGLLRTLYLAIKYAVKEFGKLGRQGMFSSPMERFMLQTYGIDQKTFNAMEDSMSDMGDSVLKWIDEQGDKIDESHQAYIDKMIEEEKRASQKTVTVVGKASDNIVYLFGSSANKSVSVYESADWTGAGAYSTAQIKSQVIASGITAMYSKQATDALSAYLNVTWATGGTVSADGIKNALVKAGVPLTMAEQAASGLVAFVNTINGGKGQVTTAIDGLSSGASASGANGGTAWANAFVNSASAVLGSVGVTSNSSSGGTTRFHMIKDAMGGFMKFARGGFVPMADGGLFSQGTMYVAGEVPGQAEMVGNINGRTGVASGYEITGIRDAVLNTGEAEVALLNRLLTALERKQLVIAPSAQLGRVVAQSNRMYGAVTG